MKQENIVTLVIFGSLVTLLVLIGFYKQPPEPPPEPRVESEFNEQPPENFAAICKDAEARRIYKTHDGKWACQTKDGRTLINEIWTDGFWEQSTD